MDFDHRLLATRGGLGDLAQLNLAVAVGSSYEGTHFISLPDRRACLH